MAAPFMLQDLRILTLTSVAEAKLSVAYLVLYHGPSPPVCINGGFWSSGQMLKQFSKPALHLAGSSQQVFDHDLLLHEQFWHWAWLFDIALWTGLRGVYYHNATGFNVSRGGMGMHRPRI